MADRNYPQEQPFVAPPSSPQASDHRQDAATTEPARTAEAPKRQAAKQADDDKDTRTSAQKRADKQQAQTEKADREAERGKRSSAYAYGQAGVTGQSGPDARATRTWAHRQCGTEIEVPADQSHPAESKCMGCRMDVSPADWVLRD